MVADSQSAIVVAASRFGLAVMWPDEFGRLALCLRHRRTVKLGEVTKRRAVR